MVDITSLSVTVGGTAAEVLWAGLAPGVAGVYQINLRVPPHAPQFANLDVRAAVDGRLSGVATLSVRAQ